jgi:hypothetical protein
VSRFAHERLQSFRVGLIVVPRAGVVEKRHAHDLCVFVIITAFLEQQTYQ